MFQRLSRRTGGATTPASGSVTLSHMADLAEGTVIGRAVGAGTGAPTALTGTQQVSNQRWNDILIDTTSSGTIASYNPTGFSASTYHVRVSPVSDMTIHGMPLATGQAVLLRVGRGSSTTLTLTNESASASAATERFSLPNNQSLTLRAGESAWVRNGESRNNVVSVGRQTNPLALAPINSLMAVPFMVYVNCPSGGASGTADDVTVWNATAPFGLRIIDAQLRVSTAVGGSSAALRTASGGGGSVVLPDPAAATQTFSTAAAGVLEDLATATATVASGGSLFLRRSDRSVVGELMLTCIRT